MNFDDHTLTTGAGDPMKGPLFLGKLNKDIQMVLREKGSDWNLVGIEVWDMEAFREMLRPMFKQHPMKRAASDSPSDMDLIRGTLVTEDKSLDYNTIRLRYGQGSSRLHNPCNTPMTLTVGRLIRL